MPAGAPLVTVNFADPHEIPDAENAVFVAPNGSP